MSESIVFAGLPHTGKTTYLGLLNLAVTRKTRVTIRLGSFKDDREYLNGLSKNLFTCEEPLRTEVDQRRGLALSTEIGERASWLEIPDLSGEIWLEALSDRTLPADLNRAVREATGVCVFVHAGEFPMDPTLGDLAGDLSALGIARGEDGNEDFASREPGGQTALVDLLQVVGYQLRDVGSAVRRVSLVLSAFDVSGAPTAAEWLRECAPLAAQYLKHTALHTDARVFALSAQGGDFSDPKARQVLSRLDPLARAEMMRDDGTVANLDDPICWALGID